MAQSLPLASKTKSCAPNSVKFSPNNLYYNYSCAGFHELNMSCVWEWDAIEVNDKRQPVIEVVATWAYWTNPWLGHVTAVHQWLRSFSPQSQGSWENWFLIWAVFDSFWNQKLKLTNLRPVITKEQIKLCNCGSSELWKPVKKRIFEDASSSQPVTLSASCFLPITTSQNNK